MCGIDAGEPDSLPRAIFGLIIALEILCGIVSQGVVYDDAWRGLPVSVVYDS
jgi:hypothetical protein